MIEGRRRGRFRKFRPSVVLSCTDLAQYTGPNLSPPPKSGRTLSGNNEPVTETRKITLVYEERIVRPSVQHALSFSLFLFLGRLFTCRV